MNVGITGIGHAYPDKILTNQDLEKIVDTSDEWILTRTGIKERRIASASDGTSRWAVEAGKKALKQAQLLPEDIELLIIGTTTPDMPLPSCACLVQELLGVKKAVAFDVSAACAGFIYALSNAQAYIQTGKYKNALVIGADQISPYIDWQDRSTCVLFGDGAGACVLQEVNERGIIDISLGSDGQYAPLIHIPSGGSKEHVSEQTIQKRGHFLKMNGKEVFKQAVRGMTQSIEHILIKTQTKIDDVKCVIPHQANMRIIDAVAQRLKLSKESIYINLDRFGNTSAASVIMALSEALDKQAVRKSDLVILTTFGAGLVWGSALIEL